MIFQQGVNLHSNSMRGCSSHSFGTRHADVNEDVDKCTSIISMEQVHDAEIEMIDENSSTRVPGVDALISRLSGYMITVRTADCLPILFSDEIAGMVGVAHCGWKGSHKRLCEKMTARMQLEGSRADNIQVAIGPGIGSCCYEIYGDRLEMFKSEFEYWPNFVEKSGNMQTLNLIRLNYRQLIDTGIRQSNIDFFPFCTNCDSNRFYSYNRDKTADRMTSFITR